jgi:probable rRNA maturation factor
MTTAAHRILITIDESFVADVAVDDLQNIAVSVLQSERVGAAELGVVVTDDEMVRRLNREYAGDDHATDVLSFSLREGEEFSNPDGVERLGEVIISHPTAVRQAETAGHDVEAEVAHLLVHGILHLLGYDHLEPQDAAVMRRKEDDLLSRAHRH